MMSTRSPKADVEMFGRISRLHSLRRNAVIARHDDARERVQSSRTLLLRAQS
jgi:hypothetical protein